MTEENTKTFTPYSDIGQRFVGGSLTQNGVFVLRINRTGSDTMNGFRLL